jgi:GNAT superfamily N-acetyltransferase
MSAETLCVVPVRGPIDQRAFLRVPYDLYRDDPHWAAPIRWAERRRWSAKHNASLRSRWVQCFVARRGTRVVGRIAAVVDEAFAERWMPGAGFFGFFECEEDIDAAAALFSAAEAALRERGRSCVIGPINLTTHDEVGLLVEGFGMRPTVLSPYNPPYYPALVEESGYGAFRDYHAFLWRPQQSQGAVISRLERAAARRAGVFGQVRLRPANVARWDEEVRSLHAVYNEAFADLWGFVPISLDEFAERAASFRPFFRPELLIIAEAEARAVGFALLLPDINEVLAPLRGRLLPFGWFRLMRAIPRIRSGRFILIGVAPEFASRGLAPVLAAEIQAAGRRLGLDPVEISLVAGANRAMQRVIEAFGCPHTKTFRLYRKSLVPDVAPTPYTARE